MAVEDVPKDRIINERKTYFQVLYYIPLRDLYRWDDRYSYMAALGYIPVEGQTVPPTLPPGPGTPFSAAETLFLNDNYSSKQDVQNAVSTANSALGLARDVAADATQAKKDASEALGQVQGISSAVDTVRRSASDAATAAGNAATNASNAATNASNALEAVKRTVKDWDGVIRSGDGVLSKLPDLTSSKYVIALGRNAMQNMEQIQAGIAIGQDAAKNSTIWRDNIAIGESALRNTQARTPAYDQSQQQGTRNIGIGGNAGHFNKEGYAHVIIGRNAGHCIEAGTGLVAIGGNANGGVAPIGFSGDIENGAPWGTDGQTIYTVAVGNRTLSGNTADKNVGVGGYALQNNKKSNNNTAIGAQALQSLDIDTGYHGGTYTTMSINGTYSQVDTTLTMSIPNHGLAAGDLAYVRLLDGPSKTFQNDLATAQVQSVPDANTFVLFVPKSITGTGTAMLGAKETSIQKSQNGGNTALGANAGQAQRTGSNNTFLGQSAASLSMGGDQSTAVGMVALGRATSVSNCTALGFYAAGSQTGSSSRVTALGASALRNRVDGTEMTDDWTNVVGLGYDSRVSGANQVALGNSSSTVYAQSAVQTRSDRRDKADICATELGLENFILKLKPSQWRWDRREDYTITDDTGAVVEVQKRDGSKKGERFHQGFIAQDVQQVIEDSGVDFGGFQDHKIAGGDDVYSLGYEEFIAPMVNAMQEMHGMIDSLKKEIAELKSGASK